MRGYDSQEVIHEELAPLFEQSPGADISVGKGWYGLVLDLHTQLAKLDPDYDILQVKEKFGGLRYYISSNDESATTSIRYLVSKTEDDSFATCEFCGSPGASRNGQWVKTLCDDCSNCSE